MTKDGEALLEVGIEAPVGEVAHCNLDDDEMKTKIMMVPITIAFSPVWEAIWMMMKVKTMIVIDGVYNICECNSTCLGSRALQS